MDKINSQVVTEKELLTITYDRYFGLQAEAEKKEYEDMRNRKSERLGHQCTVLHYSQPCQTIDEERTAMKSLAVEVKKCIMSGEPQLETYGIIMARLFFGNYAKHNHPGNRGRGWNDADMALWINWIRQGLPGNEWHNYYSKFLKQH